MMDWDCESHHSCQDDSKLSVVTSVHPPMASRALRIALIPGDGIGREVIPVSPANVVDLLSILTDIGRPTSTRSHCEHFQP